MRKLSLLSLSIIGLPIIASAATVTVYDDVPENAWFAGYVHQATTLDIVGGYRDTNGRLTGKFGPSDKLTIAQALKMSVVAAGYDPTEYTVGDNWVSLWYGPYVGVAQTERFSFFLDRTTGFENAATRGEVAQIVADAFRVWLSGDTAHPFKDVPENSKHAKAIDQLYVDGVISGDTDAYGHTTGSFRPGDSINRAEAVKLVMRAYEVYGAPAEDDEANEDTDPKTEPNAPTVSVVSYSDANGFSPASYFIEPGTTVRFENQSTTDLKVTSEPALTEIFTVKPGATHAYTFHKTGTYMVKNGLQMSDSMTVYVVE